MSFSRHLLLACLIVLFTIVSGQIIERGALTGVVARTVSGTIFEANVLSSSPTNEDFYLDAKTIAQGSKIQYSSQSEIYRFSIFAPDSYTLRYATIFVDSTGLALPTDPALWKVYLVKDGRVDFAEAVGYGEKFTDGELRLRFFADDNPATGFLGILDDGDAGETVFAVVSSVMKDGSSNEPSLRVNLVSGSGDGRGTNGWAFTFGAYNRSWMNVEDALGSDMVRGLPTGVNEKR